MRSALFVLIFSVCVLAMGCAASTENPGGAENSEHQKALDSGVTTKETEAIPATDPEPEAPKTRENPEADLTEAAKQLDGHLLPGKPLTQPQIQPQQLTQSHTSQITVGTQGKTGDPSQNGHGAAEIGRTEAVTLTAPIATAEKDTEANRSQKDDNALNQASTNQHSPSSHHTKIDVTMIQEKQPTPSTTTEHTPIEKTDSATTHTEGAPQNPNNSPKSPLIITDDQTVILDTDATSRTTETLTTHPQSQQTENSATTERNLHTQVHLPTSTSTGHTGVNPSDKDQHHSTPTSQTSSAGNGLSPNTTPQTKKVTTPHSQPVSQEKPQAAPSKSVQSQAPAQTLDSDKTKKTVNGITPSVAAATLANKKTIIPNIPATTATVAPNNAASMTDTTTGDKETHTEQTSVSSTSIPVNVVSTPLANNSENLSKALHSLDNKDSSIGSSLLIAFAALTIVVVMVVTPAS